MLAVAKRELPGSSRSGENARKKSSPQRSPDSSRIPRTSSSVVPGYVVDSRTTSCPRRSRGWICRTVFDDEAHVRLALRRQRRRDADEQHVRSGQLGEIRGRAEEARGGGRGQPATLEVLDVVAPGAERVDLLGIDVEPDDRDALLGEGQGERQPDVPEAEDADDERAVVDPFLELRRGGRPDARLSWFMLILVWFCPGFAPFGVPSPKESPHACRRRTDEPLEPHCGSGRVQSTRDGVTGTRASRSNSTATDCRSIEMDTIRRSRDCSRSTLPV